MQMLEGDGTRLTRMEAVAQAVGVSRRQLHRIFADKLATSPARFRRKVRLDRAHQMLANAEASVTEVAMATGFKSRSYFWRCYRQEFGRSPSSDKR